MARNEICCITDYGCDDLVCVVGLECDDLEVVTTEEVWPEDWPPVPGFTTTMGGAIGDALFVCPAVRFAPGIVLGTGTSVGIGSNCTVVWLELSDVFEVSVVPVFALSWLYALACWIT